MSEEITPEVRNQVAGDIVAKLTHRLSVLNTTIDQTHANYNALCGRRLELQETLMHMTRLAQVDPVPPAGDVPPADIVEPPKVELDDEGNEIVPEDIEHE